VLHRRVNAILSVVMNMQYIKLSRCTSSLTSSSQSLSQQQTHALWGSDTLIKWAEIDDFYRASLV